MRRYRQIFIVQYCYLYLYSKFKIKSFKTDLGFLKFLSFLFNFFWVHVKLVYNFDVIESGIYVQKQCLIIDKRRKIDKRIKIYVLAGNKSESHMKVYKCSSVWEWLLKVIGIYILNRIFFLNPQKSTKNGKWPFLVDFCWLMYICYCNRWFNFNFLFFYLLEHARAYIAGNVNWLLKLSVWFKFILIVFSLNKIYYK
jgi:hypothetical protein